VQPCGRNSTGVQSCVTNSHDLGLLVRPRNKCVKPQCIEWDRPWFNIHIGAYSYRLATAASANVDGVFRRLDSDDHSQ